MQNYAAITENSVWLIEANDDFTSGHVVDRATFGSPYIEDGRRFAGPILTGDDGLNLRPGTRIVMRNTFADSHGDTDRIVTSGAIVRLVQCGDTPKEESVTMEVDGKRIETIRLDPSWSFLLPFVMGGSQVMAEARRAFRSADILRVLVDMGRVTQDDMHAAEQRGL